MTLLPPTPAPPSLKRTNHLAAPVMLLMALLDPARGLAQSLTRTDCFVTPAPGARLFVRSVALADRVDHSIPGSGAFGIETPIGWVVYTGDLRMHGHSKWRTEKLAEAAAALKPALLIVEGTRLDVEKPLTEPEVHKAADEVVAREPGLVMADFTARNMERLLPLARALGSASARSSPG